MRSSSVVALQQASSRLMSPSLVLERVAGTGVGAASTQARADFKGHSSVQQFPRPDQKYHAQCVLAKDSIISLAPADDDHALPIHRGFGVNRCIQAEEFVTQPPVSIVEVVVCVCGFKVPWVLQNKPYAGVSLERWDREKQQPALSHNKFKSCQRFGRSRQGHYHLTPLFLVCVRSLACFTMFRFSEFPGFLMFSVVHLTLFHHFM